MLLVLALAGLPRPSYVLAAEQLGLRDPARLLEAPSLPGFNGPVTLYLLYKFLACHNRYKLGFYRTEVGSLPCLVCP